MAGISREVMDLLGGNDNKSPTASSSLYGAGEGSTTRLSPGVGVGCAAFVGTRRGGVESLPPAMPSRQFRKSIAGNGTVASAGVVGRGTDAGVGGSTVPIAGAVTGDEKSGGNAGGNSTSSLAAHTKAVKPARKWVWVPFSSSARTDGCLFRHWVRAGVEYPDYPYARFDVHLDPLTYTDEEYSALLEDGEGMGWTRSETDKLMELCRIFELRWPVIHDRHLWDGGCRTVDELMHRYYSVGTALTKARLEDAVRAEVSVSASADDAHCDVGHPGKGEAADGTGVEDGAKKNAGSKALASSPSSDPGSAMVKEAMKHHVVSHLGTGSSTREYCLGKESERRRQMEAVWSRTKEEEAEDAALRKELKIVEAQIRKLKKSGKHLLAGTSVAAAAVSASDVVESFGADVMGNISAAAASSSAAVASTGIGADLAISGAGAGVTSTLDQAFAASSPVPAPGHPYLQSSRLASPQTGGPTGLNKTLLKKMDLVLKELNVPDHPLPTKRTCDAYDVIRKDVLTLITLKKIAAKKEGEIASKRAKLAKLGAIPPQRGSGGATTSRSPGLKGSSSSSKAAATEVATAASSSSTSSMAAFAVQSAGKSKGGSSKAKSKSKGAGKSSSDGKSSPQTQGMSAVAVVASGSGGKTFPGKAALSAAVVATAGGGVKAPGGGSAGKKSMKRKSSSKKFSSPSPSPSSVVSPSPLSSSTSPGGPTNLSSNAAAAAAAVTAATAAAKAATAAANAKRAAAAAAAAAATGKRHPTTLSGGSVVAGTGPATGIAVAPPSASAPAMSFPPQEQQQHQPSAAHLVSTTATATSNVRPGGTTAMSAGTTVPKAALSSGNVPVLSGVAPGTTDGSGGGGVKSGKKRTRKN